MQIIEPSPRERAAGRLAPLHLDAAKRALIEDGLVLLRQIAHHDELDRLGERMAADTRQLLAFVERNGGNPRARGHLQQGPPPTRDFVLPSVAANPIVAQVTDAALGSRPKLTFYNGNTNCPGSSVQGLHMDTGHLFPDWDTPTPAWQIVVNVPPDDCTVQNGAIELWPGTHRVVRHAKPVSPEAEARRRRERPPERGVSEKGDVLLRDGRIWHRGVPNATEKPRQMIALIHSAPWSASNRVAFQTGCDVVLEAGDFDANATYTDQPIDYLYGPSRRLFEARGIDPI